MMQQNTWILLAVGLLLSLSLPVDAEERQVRQAVETRVGQWQLHELSFPNIAILKNPFSVKLNGVLMLIQPGAGQRTCSTCREGSPPVGVLAGRRLPTFALVDRDIIDYRAQPWARKGVPDQMAMSADDVDFGRFFCNAINAHFRKETVPSLLC